MADIILKIRHMPVAKKTVTGILHLTGAGVKAAGFGTVELEKEPGAALLFLLLNM